jgi:hypothetical protein
MTDAKNVEVMAEDDQAGFCKVGSARIVDPRNPIFVGRGAAKPPHSPQRKYFSGACGPDPTKANFATALDA